MRSTIKGVLAAAIVATSLTFAGPAAASGHNCSDYATQEEAQAAYNANPSDPEGLDRNNNGIACETRPKAGATPGTTTPGPKTPGTKTPGTKATPVGGVEAGFGGTADGDVNGPAGLAGIGTLLALGGAVMLRRRMTQ